MVEIPRHHRIVVGVDGSANSVAALRWALAEASRLGSTTVWAVLVWPGKRETPAATDVVPTPEARWRTAGAVLTTAVAAAGEVPAGVWIREIVETGDVVPILLWHAAEADLLVLGSRRRQDVRLHGRATSIPGQTARACRSHAACPVVVVSPTGRPSPITPPGQPDRSTPRVAG